MKLLIVAFIGIFLLQNSIYKRTVNRELKQFAYEIEQREALQIFDSFDPDELQEELEKEEIKKNVWNCTNLYLGANFLPSIQYQKQFWRVFSCFFLHENLQHLVLNLLVILYYYGRLLFSIKKQKKAFIGFLLSTLIFSNFLSNLFQPDLLKIGSSFLTVFLVVLGFLESLQQFNQYLLLDFMTLFFLFLGVFDDRIDNFLHFAGALSGFFYWASKDSKAAQEVMIKAVSIMSIAMIVYFMSTQEYLNPEDAVILATNYGCSGFAF